MSNTAAPNSKQGSMSWFRSMRRREPGQRWALGVAIALNAGAALAYSARVLDAYAAIDGAAKSAAE